MRVEYLGTQPGCVSLACTERTQSALHVTYHISRTAICTARREAGEKRPEAKKRKRRQRYTLRYFLNSPSQAVYIPQWLCVLQSYALRRESHPSGFFARRLDVISQTTGSPREMAVSVVRYLALLVFYALLQYRKYWQWNSRSAASRLSISSFRLFPRRNASSIRGISRVRVVVYQRDRYVGDRRSICKKRQIKHLKIRVSLFASVTPSCLYMSTKSTHVVSQKNKSAFLILIRHCLLHFKGKFFLSLLQKKEIFF